MKVILINGSPNEKGCTYTALSEIEKQLHKHDIETELIYLGKNPIPGCIACGICRKTGKCFIDDQVNTIIEKSDSFNAIIFGSPVYYASASGQITSFLDRLFFAGSTKFRNKPGASIVSCRRAGSTAAFDQLNKYFTISSMPIISSQYWNQVHGNTPQDVMQDHEGLQTMRTLANNMVWLLRCIEAGKNAGVPLPQSETKVATNFIR